MRKELEHISKRIEWIDTDNLYEAINSIKELMSQMVVLIDLALPVDRSDDV